MYDVRYLSSFLWGGGGHSVRCWVGACATGRLKPFLSVAHAHTAKAMGLRSPGFEVFCNQQELFNVTSNALCCILQVWQDFILDVVLRLLSRSTKFSQQQTHQKLYTSRTRQIAIHLSA